jgi:curved DNA-binding protein CbpA
VASEEEVIALAERVEQLSYFQILGLPHRYATLAEVKASFHAFALHFHPDQFTGVDDEVKQSAKEVFKRAVEAYEVLRDARLQRRYVEAYLKKGEIRMAPVEFARRASMTAIPTAGMPSGPSSSGPASPAAGRPSVAGAPPAAPTPGVAGPRPKPLSEMTWIDEMRSEDGREVARRIDKMMRDGRFQPALQQMSLLESLEPGNPAVAARMNMLRRRLDQGR